MFTVYILYNFNFNFVVPASIDRVGMKDQTVTAGKKIEFNITIGGEPAPETEWQLNGKTLKPSKRIEIETKATQTRVNKNQLNNNFVSRFPFMINCAFC